MPLFNPIEERMRGHNSSGSDVIAGGDRIGNTSSYYTYRIESTRSIPPPTSQLIFGARNVSIVFRTLWRLGKLAKPLANHRTVHPWFKVRQLIERTFHYSNRILNHCLTIFSIAIESSINFWSLVPFSIGHLSTIIKEISRNRYIYIIHGISNRISNVTTGRPENRETDATRWKARPIFIAPFLVYLGASHCTHVIHPSNAHSPRVTRWMFVRGRGFDLGRISWPPRMAGIKLRVSLLEYYYYRVGIRSRS